MSDERKTLDDALTAAQKARYAVESLRDDEINAAKAEINARWAERQAEASRAVCAAEPAIKAHNARRAIELGAVPPAPRDPVDELAEEIRKMLFSPQTAGPVATIAAYVHANFTRKAP